LALTKTERQAFTDWPVSERDRREDLINRCPAVDEAMPDS
jgi:hypothetical protein